MEEDYKNTYHTIRHHYKSSMELPVQELSRLATLTPPGEGEYILSFKTTPVIIFNVELELIIITFYWKKNR